MRGWLSNLLKPRQLSELQSLVASLPAVRLEAAAPQKPSVGGAEASIDVTLTPTNSGHRKMVHAPRFPKPKLGGWWLILGVDDELLALKRVHVGRGPTRASLAFVAPDDGGDHEYELHLVSDSYVGLDQVQPVTVRVAEACD